MRVFILLSMIALTIVAAEETAAPPSAAPASAAPASAAPASAAPASAAPAAPASAAPAVSAAPVSAPVSGSGGLTPLTVKLVPLENKAVYQIVNKGDGGAMTVGNKTADVMPVTSQAYDGNAGQKWRLRKGYYGTSFHIVPTVNEHAVLDLDHDNIGFFGRVWARGNQKFWHLYNVGDGRVKIQNYQKPDLCLTGKGKGKAVGMAVCENSPAQQWEFTLL